MKKLDKRRRRESKTNLPDDRPIYNPFKLTLSVPPPSHILTISPSAKLPKSSPNCHSLICNIC